MKHILTYMRRVVVAVMVIALADAAKGGISLQNNLPGVEPHFCDGSKPLIVDPSTCVQSAHNLDTLFCTSSTGYYSALPSGETSFLAESLNGDTLRELPPAPSSISLVLSALASLGAYHGARSLKRLHFDFTPEWYHSGGPAQIGHATPLQLEFVRATLAICPYDIPISGPVWTCRIPREPCSRLLPQSILLAESPRAPPFTD